MHSQTSAAVQRPPQQFEVLSVVPANISAPQQAILQAAQPGFFEPFVDEFVTGRFLQIEPRRVLEMARAGEIPSHPIGRTRKTWRFRLSEIDAHFSTPRKPVRATMAPAVPGTPEKRHRG
jgi:hypothetical protein